MSRHKTTEGASSALPLAAGRAPPLRGRIQVPGDKSISHRALIIALATAGQTEITGLLEGADVLATARIIGQLGATVERLGAGAWRVWGRGLAAISSPDDILDFENSGTSARLMMGIIATHAASAHLTGDTSLRQRPMARIITPLERFGAVFHSRDGSLPIFVRGTADARPISYRVPVPSAQVKSAVLLAGLNAPGETCVIEPVPTRDHTERLLSHFGAQISSETTDEGRVIRLQGQPELRPRPIHVPADPSSAAFPLVAGLVVPGSEVTVEAVLLNEGRSGLFTTLQEMGAVLTYSNEREQGGERVADITTKASTLRGVLVPAERAASMIDEYPILAVAAAFAEGETRMEGLAELRVKESDRLAAISAGLAASGVQCTEGPETLLVQGMGIGGVPGGGRIATHMDHRIAMAFLTLGLGAKSGARIDDGRMIDTSFPGYQDTMQKLGAPIRISNQ